MMNVHMASFIHCATRRFKLIGFQHVLFQQSSNTLYSEGRMFYHSSEFSLKLASKRHGILNLLNHHPLNKMSDNFELFGRLKRNMNIFTPKIPFERLDHKGSYQQMLMTCTLLRLNVSTIALGADEEKTDVVNMEPIPKYVDSYTGPERDLINFPRPVRSEYPEKVRYAFIPESWFQSFYNKTGVTGPYTLLFTTMTYLISKEIYVLEHEFYSGISVAIMCHYGVKNFGPSLAAFLDKNVDDCAQGWEMLRKQNQKAYEDGIENERVSQFESEGQMKLFEIKKQVIAIQLECEYRKRLWEAYNEVVQQLEKELQKQQVHKCIAHKNMQQWVLSEVLQGITSDLKLQVLKWALFQIQEIASHHQYSSFPLATGRDQESGVIVACVSETSGLGISPQGSHVISKRDENNHLDECQVFPLLFQPPDSEYK